MIIINDFLASALTYLIMSYFLSNAVTPDVPGPLGAGTVCSCSDDQDSHPTYKWRVKYSSSLDIFMSFIVQRGSNREILLVTILKGTAKQQKICL